MNKKYREGILPFKFVATNEPLIARGGLVPAIRAEALSKAKSH